ncbi:MAG: tetratricopeptide repeat protein [Prevotella sp.]|nr:tetratricopeptide repeat protein [Prevotella sp.]MCI1281412.1 tetratricopeptide repeat protein [Prevotella sp.]
MKKVFIFLILLCALTGKVEAQTSDSDKLGMALEYFQAGKYHECMILLEKLDKKYKLNPRFRAYLGVCYYYEWDYEKAAKCLDAMIPELNNFAPHERSVYYWSCAESHFNMQQYSQAISPYEQMLTVCYDNERPDALYRLGFCYLFLKDWQNSYDYFDSSLSYYKKYRANDQQARIAQISNMLTGIKEHLPKPVVMTDTIKRDMLKEKVNIRKDTLISVPIKDINLEKIYKPGVILK